MAVEIVSEDGLLIRKLVPIATLPSAAFSALCTDLAIEETIDATLFQRGDVDNQLIYLIDGEVILQADGLIVETIKARSDAAKFALAHQIPRKIDAVAKGKIRFLRLKAEMINHLPSIEHDEDSYPMIVEDSDENTGDWMTTLLKSPVFQRLPPANLQKILMALENVDYDKGGVIIEQGAQGDYYYLLKKGQCLVTRKPTANAKEIKLGVLDKGETFGEDSLLTGAPRTVSITALTDVSLLRLDKRMFVSLIKEPSLKFLDYESLDAAIYKGAQLLDIRPPDDYERHHLEGSINLPYFSLRMQLKSLNREKTAVLICSDGKASEAGAFLLLKNKFNAVVLKGGMASVPQKTAGESANFEIDDGIETMIQLPNSTSTESPEGSLDECDTDTGDNRWREQINTLTIENDQLKNSIHQLTEKCKQLEQERDQLEQQFQRLSEKLKRPAVSKDSGAG